MPTCDISAIDRAMLVALRRDRPKKHLAPLVIVRVLLILPYLDFLVIASAAFPAATLAGMASQSREYGLKIKNEGGLLAPRP
jgi:hypothetical protein